MRKPYLVGLLVLGMGAIGGSQALAYSSLPITDMIHDVAKVIKGVALLLGWGLGFWYCMTGLKALAESGDEPQLKRVGVNRFSGGIMLIGLSTIVKWIAEELGISGFSNISLF